MLSLLKIGDVVKSWKTFSGNVLNIATACNEIEFHFPWSWVLPNCEMRVLDVVATSHVHQFGVMHHKALKIIHQTWCQHLTKIHWSFSRLTLGSLTAAIFFHANATHANFKLSYFGMLWGTDGRLQDSPCPGPSYTDQSEQMSVCRSWVCHLHWQCGPNQKCCEPWELFLVHPERPGRERPRDHPFLPQNFHPNWNHQPKLSWSQSQTTSQVPAPEHSPPAVSRQVHQPSEQLCQSQLGQGWIHRS